MPYVLAVGNVDNGLGTKVETRIRISWDKLRIHILAVLSSLLCVHLRVYYEI